MERRIIFGFVVVGDKKKGAVKGGMGEERKGGGRVGVRTSREEEGEGEGEG